MARKVCQFIRRGDRTWLVRVYNGRDPESKKRKYLNQTVQGGAQGRSISTEQDAERTRSRPES